MTRSADVRTAASVFFILLSIYLLTATKVLYVVADEGFVFATIENIAKFGRFDVEQIASVSKSPQWEFGVDGRHYSKYGLMQAVLAVPLYMVAVRIPELGNADLVLLFNAIITAFTGAFVLLSSRVLGYSVATSVVASLIFGLGTIAWPYSKGLLGEPGSALFLLSSIYCLLRFDRNRRRAPLLLAGAMLGMAFAFKASNGIIVLAELAFLTYITTGLKERIKSALTLILPLTGFIALVGFYNYARFGDVWTTGYGPHEGFTAPLFQGLWGFLLSPSRSFFLYSPVLVVSLVGFIPFAKKHRSAALLLALSVLLQLLLYAQWWHWWGGLSWGPRFLVPLAPIMTLGLLPVIERARAGAKWPLTILASSLALSLAVQLLGVVDRSVGYLRDSPLLGKPGYPLLDHLDFIWIYNRQPGIPPEIDSLSLALMAGLILLSVAGALFLARGGHAAASAVAAGSAHWAVLCLLAFVAVGVVYTSLARSYHHVASEYRAMVSEIAPRSDSGGVRDFTSGNPDAVIYSDFLRNDEFFNLNKSSARVLGWGEEEHPSPQLERRLDEIAHGIAAAPSSAGVLVHVTPNPPGSPGNGIERFLQERFFVAETLWFGNTRLVRYVAPKVNTENTRTIQAAMDPNLAGLAKLRGLTVTHPAEEGAYQQSPLFVRLEWESLAPLRTSYTVSLRLISPDGRLVAQRDQRPAGGMMPTTAWLPGQVIVDNYVLWVDAELPAGTYALVVGMYELATGDRLSVVDPAEDSLGDFLRLTTIELT